VQLNQKGYLALGLMIAVTLAAAIAAWLRRHRSSPAMALPAPTSVPAGPANGEPVKIPFSCSSCGKHLKVKKTLAGKQVRCPTCGQVVLVPVSAQVTRPA
jgi:DNA-directed RNA polymerase subunit RPC12/RpoP